MSIWRCICRLYCSCCVFAGGCVSLGRPFGSGFPGSPAVFVRRSASVSLEASHPSAPNVPTQRSAIVSPRMIHFTGIALLSKSRMKKWPNGVRFSAVTLIALLGERDAAAPSKPSPLTQDGTPKPSRQLSESRFFHRPALTHGLAFSLLFRLASGSHDDLPHAPRSRDRTAGVQYPAGRTRNERMTRLV